jgi:hypothetical protein
MLKNHRSILIHDSRKPRKKNKEALISKVLDSIPEDRPLCPISNLTSSGNPRYIFVMLLAHHLSTINTI